MKYSKSEIAADSTSGSSTPTIAHYIQSYELRSCSHNYSHVMVCEFENNPPKFNTFFLRQNAENQTKPEFFFTPIISQRDQMASRPKIKEKNTRVAHVDLYKHPSGTTYILRKLNPNGRDNSKA